MKPLLEFHDRHPSFTTVATVASGLLAWVFDHTQQITAVAGMIGAVCAALVAFAGLLAKLWHWSTLLVAAFRRMARRLEQRRLHQLDAPLEPRPLPRVIVEANDDGTFTIHQAVDWIDLETGAHIHVPTGELTDFASVPRVLWPIIPPYGRHSLAAVIHDHLYKVRGILPRHRLARWQCDRIFREVMTASGVRWTRRWVMWLGVRLGGWVPWNRAAE